jgi:hypothetical protein
MMKFHFGCSFSPCTDHECFLFWWTATCDLNIPSSYHLSGEFKAACFLSEALPKDACVGGDSFTGRGRKDQFSFYIPFWTWYLTP